MHVTQKAGITSALVLVAYVLLCTIQVDKIQKSVGLRIPFFTVMTSTVGLMVDHHPWIPFVMTPPTDASTD